MTTSTSTLAGTCLAALFLVGCVASAPAPGEPPSAQATPATPAAQQTTPPGTVTLPTGFPERPFVRVEFDTLTWRPTEGNTLGVQTAVVEGDPTKPGYYLTINHFPK